MAKHFADERLPCKKKLHSDVVHFSQITTARHLLAETTDFCTQHGKVPLLSNTALHHLHIFIFVLAVAHVSFCALTILFGVAKIRQWKDWEDSILKEEFNPEEVLKKKFTSVQDHAFIRGNFSGIGKNSALLGWLQTFFKQFYGSVTKSDYITLRLGFIMTHCRGNQKFNFHKYTIRALEADFKKVVGISWYLWLFVVVFLLLNVHGWHAYFWIAFIPLILLLAVGTKLEHVISQLAQEVAEKHVAIQGDLVVKPSGQLFWFHRPRLVLVLIHIILFQNSFEIAVFFWIWYQYKFGSCIMGEVGYIIPRLVIGVIVQFLCSYSTLPLYALVTQMGTSFKKAIFGEDIQEGIDDWAQKTKRNKGLRMKAIDGSRQVGPKKPSPTAIQMVQVIEEKESDMEQGNTPAAAGEITPASSNSYGQK